MKPLTRQCQCTFPGVVWFKTRNVTATQMQSKTVLLIPVYIPVICLGDGAGAKGPSDEVRWRKEGRYRSEGVGVPFYMAGSVYP
jgi:hypothetical protein